MPMDGFAPEFQPNAKPFVFGGITWAGEGKGNGGGGSGLGAPQTKIIVGGVVFFFSRGRSLAQERSRKLPRGKASRPPMALGMRGMSQDIENKDRRDIQA